MFELLKAQYSDMLGWAQQGMPQDRFMELELETGNTRMQRSPQLKRLSMASSWSCTHN